VHISALTNKFISDPREVVKAGDIVKVKVMEVDVARKRISFTMRLEDTPNQSRENTNGAARDSRSKQDKGPRSNQNAHRGNQRGGQHRNAKPQQTQQNSAMGNAFADALAKAKK